MAITRQNIVDAYNSIYSVINGGVLKTYEQLNKNEVDEALLILLNNNGGGSGGGGSGATEAEIKNAIETATNLDQIESRLLNIQTATGTTIIETLDIIFQAIGNSNDLAESDIGFSSVIGYLSRLLSVKLPETLGTKTAVNSFAVTLASNEPLVGITTETAPASDTASSGLNGRLQRIAQRITSLIALLPTSLGAKTAANSFPVALATDQIFVTSGAQGNLVGNVNSTSTPGAALTVNSVSLYENIVVQTTTITSGTLTFQATNDITDAASWENIEGINIITGEVTNTLSPNSKYAVPIRFAAFRLYFTPIGTGSTGTIRYYYFHGNISTIADARSQVSLSAINTKLPTSLGAKTAANSLAVTLASDGAGVTALNSIDTKTPALVNSKVPVYNSTNTIVSASGASINSVVVANIDISDYSLVTVQITGTFTATIRFQGSNDNTTRVDIPVINAATGTVITGGVTTPGIYKIPKNFKFVRADLSAYTTGTITATLYASNLVDPTSDSLSPANSPYLNYSATNPAVSASVSTCLAANANVKKIVITNSGTTTVFFGFAPNGSFSATDYAFKLDTGETFIDDGLQVHRGGILALSPSGASTISVREWS